MRLLATKRTPQIMPAGVARVRNEKYPAMPAPRQTSPHLRPAAQNRAHRSIIGKHQRPDHCATAIPARPILERLLEPNGKKANSSLKLLM